MRGRTDAGAGKTVFAGTIDLGLGDDAVTIHSGNTAFGLVGVEHLNGSGQDNALTIQTNATGLAINLGGGNDSVWLANGSNSVSVTDVENVNGSDFTGGITPSNDTLELLNNVSGVTVNLGDGTNTLNLADGNNSFDALHGVNFVNGTSSSDTLTLNGYQGSVDLGGGTDTLNLNGGSFNLTVIDVETINGSALQDNLTISNTSGSTTVTAGAGYDGITAGAGQDNFRFTSVSDSLVGGSADQITNFDASSDTFTFSGIAIGDDHIEYVGTGAFAGSGQASAHLLNNGPGANVLQIDIDGDGTMTSADMEIGLNNLNGTLSNSNFLLI